MLHGRVRQFRKFMNQAAGGVHNFQKEHRTNIFLVRTEQASSIKVLLLCLYLKFILTSPKRERATKPRTLLLFRHFHISSAKCLVKRQGKGIYLTPKCFLLNIFSRTQISEIVRERSTLAVRIYLAKFGPLPGTNFRMLVFIMNQFSHIIKLVIVNMFFFLFILLLLFVGPRDQG